MSDLVEILQSYCLSLEWFFSYGNKSNQNLISSDRVEGRVYFMLDPITRAKTFSEFGGEGIKSFSGQFMLLVKSDFDDTYSNRYTNNIKPLLTTLESLEALINCSSYNITTWNIIDAINELDVNTDGIIVTFKINVLE